MQFLLFSIIVCNLILDFCVKTRTRFSFRDKRLFEIIEVEITRVDCMYGKSNAQLRFLFQTKVLIVNPRFYFSKPSFINFVSSATVINE